MSNILNRRKFLAATSATAAFTIIKPSLVFGSKANSAIRVGIAGCGNRGTEVLTEMVKSTSAQVVAMADLFDYQLEKAKPVFDKLNGQKGLASVGPKRLYQGSSAYLKLYDDKDVDAVLISSPAFTHPLFLEKAVDAGKHVYCEKPVSPDVKGCRQVMRAGEKAAGKTSLAIGFQIRLATPYMQMAALIRNGAIGEITSVQLYYISSHLKKVLPAGTSPDEFRIRNHFHFTELSGGILLDQGIHMLDVCNWILDKKPVKAFGVGNTNGGPDFGDTFTNYEVVYTYPGNISVSLHCSQIGPRFGDVCARFIGTKGVAEAHYNQGVFITGENPWDSGVAKGGELTPEQRAAGVFTSALQDANANKVKAFIESIETGKLINEANSGANSTLSAILGREASVSENPALWDDLFYSNQEYDLNLNLKQFDRE